MRPPSPEPVSEVPVSEASVPEIPASIAPETPGADASIHRFKLGPEQLTREKVSALRDFLRNNPGETKTGIEVELEDTDGQKYTCFLNLSDELSIRESPEIDVAVQAIMRM